MLSRIKQVVSALTAAIALQDRDFVSFCLNPAEQTLFWGMNLPDQRHALNVAYTALKLAENQQNVDIKLLMKSALLHDIGKIKGDVSTADKIITVMGHKLLPKQVKKWGRLGRGNKVTNVRHAFYIYFHHPRRSAAMLKKIGADQELIEIVARHHKAPTDDDPLELILLRKADDLH